MSLTINIHYLSSKNKPEKVTGSFDLTDLVANRSEIEQSGPLAFEGEAEYSAGLVEVEGEAKANMTFVCSRCLESYESELAFSFQEGYTQDSTIADADEDGNIHKVTGDEIDLKPALEENVILALPFVPLCSEDCQGLCPECGTNRNQQACSCKVEKIDPRLAGLKDFFKS